MKRRAFRICAVLLLLVVGGAIVNVAVAWAFAIWGAVSEPRELTDHSSAEAWWQMNFPSGIMGTPSWFTKEVTLGNERLDIVVLRAPEAMPAFDAVRLRSGWPAGSLERSLWSDFDRQERWWKDAWVIPRRLSPALPLRLIWPGFAIDTSFYAGALWLLFAAPFAVRRRRRIKRALCPACAYPVGESEVCTECGKLVKDVRVGTSPS